MYPSITRGWHFLNLWQYPDGGDKINKGKEKKYLPLHDISPEELITSKVSDKHVHAIWIHFKSKSGKIYDAVNVFAHPKGPYILLSSESKDTNDFVIVRQKISKAYKGRIEDVILDRGNDICQVINLKKPMTQKYLAKKVKRFYQREFNNVSISNVYYLDPESQE